MEWFNGWVETLGTIAAAAGVVASLVVGVYKGAARGAREQTARSMQPLVGDPPMQLQVPFTERMAEFLRRLDRQENRQDRHEQELLDAREELGRQGKDLAGLDGRMRRTEGELDNVKSRLDLVERRSKNTERAVHLHTRADTMPNVEPEVAGEPG